MKILTGNDLHSGRVVWWTGENWSLHVEEAVDVGEHAEEIMATEEAARRVNNPYAIGAEMTERGPRPAHIKERIRAMGPTVREDLAIPSPDRGAGSWVI